MNVGITDIEQSQKELMFSLTPEDMKPYVEKTAQRLGQEMKLKGFRDGKIPASVVQQTLGAETVWNEAIADAIEDSYAKAVGEHDLQPIGRPRVDILKLVPGNDFEFKVTIPCDPPVELPKDYRDIARKIVEKENGKPVEVDEHEIEETLSVIQNSRAEKGEDGAEVKPELNDEFAKSLGAFSSLQELKDSIREGVVKEKEQARAESTRLKVIEAIAEKTKVDIADLLVANELDKMQDEFASQATSMGTTLDEYLKQIGKTMEEVRDGWKDRAKERVRTALILRAIADEADLEPSDEEVAKRADEYLRQFGDPEEANKQVSPELLRAYIRGMLRNEKVFELLEGNSQTSNIKKQDTNKSK